MYLLKHSADISVNAVYNLLMTQHGELQRIWRPASKLEDLESQVAFETHFAGQTDRSGLERVNTYGRSRRKNAKLALVSV